MHVLVFRIYNGIWSIWDSVQVDILYMGWFNWQLNIGGLIEYFGSTLLKSPHLRLVNPNIWESKPAEKPPTSTRQATPALVSHLQISCKWFHPLATFPCTQFMHIQNSLDWTLSCPFVKTTFIINLAIWTKRCLWSILDVLIFKHSLPFPHD